MKKLPFKSVLLLGFGEVGQVLAEGILACSYAGLTVSVYDCQLAEVGGTMTPIRQALSRYPTIRPVMCANVAAQGCELVISAVTAGQALAAAESILPGLEPDTYYVDLNSVSPVTKQRLSERVNTAGGRFVEASIMSPIEPKRLQAPILLGGSYAEAFLPLGQALGFSGMSFCHADIGQAAATKMCRSVMIKGMEALITESLLSARHYGVEDAVLESLNNLFPMPDWPTHARYMISRSVEHGVRRAEEMREVAQTVQEAGINPHMSNASVERQEWAAHFKECLQYTDLNPMLDAMLQQNKNQEQPHE